MQYTNSMSKFTIIIERDEENWLVSDVVELPGCHTQAKTLPQLMRRTSEAIRAYLETFQPEVYGEFVGIQQVDI